MRSRRLIVALAAAGAAGPLWAACSVIYPVDGYDRGYGGGDAGAGGASSSSHAASSSAASSSASSASSAASTGGPVCKADGVACTPSNNDCCSKLCCPPDAGHCVTAYPSPQPELCCGQGNNNLSDNGACGTDGNIYYCYQGAWHFKTDCLSQGKVCHKMPDPNPDLCQ